MATNFKVGPCRMVYGHGLKPREKIDIRTKQPVMRDGQKVMQITFGLAIPKGPMFDAIWAAMNAEIASVFPQGVPPRFAYKLKDGDSIDSKGVPYSKREGYAGHWILSYSTELAIQCVRWDAQSGQYVQMQAHEIKTGDYFVVPTNFQAQQPKNATDTPSIYVNPQILEFVGYGTEIVSGPDAMTLLGGQTYQLPPGASATPMAPNTGGMGYPQAPGQPQPGPAVPGAPAVPQMPGYPQAPAPQPQPGGYAPQPPAPTAGGYPAPAPGGAPGAYPSSPAPQPGYPQAQAPQPAPGMPAPAPDFVHNATGQPAPYSPPPTAPGYPQAPAPQPQPGGYPPQGQPGMPGAAPGFTPPGGMQ